jgi:NMD protein affecting ribosome stability and mRNA decay
MSRENNLCQLSGNYYSRIRRCKKCGKHVAQHFIIDGVCKNCYVSEEKIHESISYIAPIVN